VPRVAPDRAAGLPESLAGAGSGHPVAAFAIALALALAPAIAAATVYKWVDANGRVVYSDQPPPPNVKTEVVKPAPPPANPAAAQELSEREQAERQKEKKRRDEAQIADKARADFERKREICVNALAQQKALQDRRDLIFRYNEKGERTWYTDEMRRADLERVQQIVRENCPG
jgi:hypothetical protein